MKNRISALEGQLPFSSVFTLTPAMSRGGISLEQIKEASGEYDPETIRWLDLSDRGMWLPFAPAGREHLLSQQHTYVQLYRRAPDIPFVFFQKNDKLFTLQCKEIL